MKVKGPNRDIFVYKEPDFLLYMVTPNSKMVSPPLIK